MKVIRINARLACIFLAILMLSLTIPYQNVLAAMVGTETVIASVGGKQALDQINNLLLREDVQSALKAQGIDPLEAKARIDSLSDAEVVRIADQIDKLPAGGNGMLAGGITPPLLPIIFGIVVVVLLIAGIVYLATNDSGHNDKE
jgi:hypothetical protein